MVKFNNQGRAIARDRKAIAGLQQRMNSLSFAALPRQKSVRRRTKPKRSNHLRNSNPSGNAWGVPQGGAVVSSARDGNTRIAFEEKWTDLRTSGAVGSLLLSLLFCPGRSGLTRLDQFGRMFDLYKVKRLVFKYRTSVGSTTAGKVLMGVDYDPKDLPTSGAGVEVLQPRARTPVWQNVVLNADVSKCQKARWMYCTSSDRDPAPGSVDDSMATACALVIDAAGPLDTELGEIWVGYDIEFSGPQRGEISNTQTETTQNGIVNMPASGAGATGSMYVSQAVPRSWRNGFPSDTSQIINGGLSSATTSGANYRTDSNTVIMDLVSDKSGLALLPGKLYKLVAQLSCGEGTRIECPTGDAADWPTTVRSLFTEWADLIGGIVTHSYTTSPHHGSQIMFDGIVTPTVTQAIIDAVGAGVFLSNFDYYNTTAGQSGQYLWSLTPLAMSFAEAAAQRAFKGPSPWGDTTTSDGVSTVVALGPWSRDPVRLQHLRRALKVPDVDRHYLTPSKRDE